MILTPKEHGLLDSSQSLQGNATEFWSINVEIDYHEEIVEAPETRESELAGHDCSEGITAS